MKTILIMIALALLICAVGYVWLNRASDRVASTVLTAFLIGGLSFFLKEAFTNKKETFSQEVSTVVFFENSSLRPLPRLDNTQSPKFSATFYWDMGHFFQESGVDVPPSEAGESDDPQAVHDKWDEEVDQIYWELFHLVLMKQIFGLQSQGWDLGVKRQHTASGTAYFRKATDRPSKELQLEQVVSQMGANRFLTRNVLMEIPDVFGGVAEFPPTIEIEFKEEWKGRQATWTFKTRFVTFSIKVLLNGRAVGLGNYYPTTQGSLNDKYSNISFFLEIEGSQTEWLNGHPDMKAHRNWADAVIAMIRDNLDYEILQNTRIKQMEYLRLFRDLERP